MKFSSQQVLLLLTIASQWVTPASANPLFCKVIGLVSNLGAPVLKTMIFEQVKDDLTISLPIGGDLVINEPRDPSFDGCSFSIPMEMGVDRSVIDIDNVGVFTLEGTLQPAALLKGNVCIEEVAVTDYMIDGLPMNLDEFLQGKMPEVGVSDQTCMSMVEMGKIAVNTLLGGGGDENPDEVRRLLRGSEVILA